jgi:chromosomal replication initiation ATPase DnaA
MENMMTEKQKLNNLLCDVCRAAGISEQQILSRSRPDPIVAARHAFCAYAEMRGFSRRQIADTLGRTYSTVMHSQKAFRNLRGRFPLMDHIYNKLNP